MRKNRLGYLAFTAVFAVLLFLFEHWYLLCAVAGMTILALLMGIFVRLDAKKLQVELGMQTGGREGESVPAVLAVRADGRLWAAGSILVTLEICHTMVDEIEEKNLLLPLTERISTFSVPMETAYCGEVCVRCREVWVLDLLRLFRIPREKPDEVRALIYPRRLNLQTVLARETFGMPEHEGMLQNRKGTDASEIFDIREYQPGDDVRSIHWKLSGKTDELIVREASDPSHYNMILLPDLGLLQGEEQISAQELNTAAALLAAVGEQLTRQGVSLCMGMLTETGLHLYEIRDSREFQQVLTQWLSLRLQEESGMALQYFILEHMEQYFTRLLIVSAGKYHHDLKVLEGRIGITLVCATEGAEVVNANLSAGCNVIEIPVEQNQKEVYRILC